MNDFFQVTNCRGKKPVLNDIKNAYLTLSAIQVELNDCEAKEHLKSALIELYIIFKKQNLIIKNNRVVNGPNKNLSKL